MIGIEVKNLTPIRRKYEKLGKGEWIKEGMQRAADYAKERAELYAPRDKGDLEDNIFVTVREDSFELGSSVRHAVFNEYGCYNLNCGTPENPEPANFKGYRPFLRPALLDTKKKLPEFISKSIHRVTHG